jgi:FMN phosphatase YigB (HAD superfamily)
MKKTIIFDWGRTLYDPEIQSLDKSVPSLLERLKEKYNFVIVSLAKDGNIQKRTELIKKYNIEKYFIKIVFTIDDKEKAYTETVNQLALSPKNTIIIDDRVVRGIAWGNMFGATTIWLKKGKFSTELPNEQTGQPTFTIKDFAELKDIL